MFPNKKIFFSKTAPSLFFFLEFYFKILIKLNCDMFLCDEDDEVVCDEDGEVVCDEDGEVVCDEDGDEDCDVVCDEDGDVVCDEDGDVVKYATQYTVKTLQI